MIDLKTIQLQNIQTDIWYYHEDYFIKFKDKFTGYTAEFMNVKIEGNKLIFSNENKKV